VTGFHKAGDPDALTPARRIIVMMLAAAAVIAGAMLILALWSVWTFRGPGPAAGSGASTDVELRQGASLPEIASDLGRAHVISSPALFMAAAQLTGGARRLKAGEYDFPSRSSMQRVLTAIRNGDVVLHLVTVPEGVTSEMVTAILMRTPYLVGTAPVAPEGAILPETYEVQRGEDRAGVLQRMMNARDALLTSLWRRRRSDLPYQTPDQAAVLASIVEKETALPDERPRIAAVFVNRLQKGMRLDSDPTVIYGLTGGRPLGHGLRASELAKPTPYNTYVIDGLPPTAIANPGRAALAAVLDPPRTNEIYFVADGQGGHVFSATLDDHLKNVARWRAVEKARSAGAPS
jgi:UPF0755 protein